MKTEKEIKEMRDHFKQEVERLELKNYNGTMTHTRYEAFARILTWVLE